MCRVLKVSRSGFYAWRVRPLSPRARENRRMMTEIRAVYHRSRRTYGSPRVHAELVEQGRQVGRHRVARLMRQEGLAGRRRRRFRKTTQSNHAHPLADNLLKRRFDVTRPNQAWVGDITYIWTLEGWLYLAVILDLYSRRVVGWAMSKRINAALTLDALKMALSGRTVLPGLLHHSDRGST